MTRHSNAHHQPASRAILPQRRTVILWLMGFAALVAIVIGSPAIAAGTYEKPKPSQDVMMHKSYQKAEAFIAEDAYEDALSALALVLLDEPKNADAWNLTGYSHRKLGHFEASMRAYEEALTIDPNHKRAMEYMGELYLTLGDVAAAEALLAKLNKACSFNCKYRDMLKKAIQNYKANQ